MIESTQVTLLRRMTRSQGQEAADNPLTSSRAVRLALTKAANDTVGLVLTVESVAEEITGLDEMLASLTGDLMLVALEQEQGLVGLIALDMEMRAAVLEMETMGAVLAHPADERAPTRTDKMLCDPLLEAFLEAFPTAVAGTPLDGWLDGVMPGDSVESLRAAGLVLEDRDYRIVRLSVNLAGAERQAQLIICLPLEQDVASIDDIPAQHVEWDSTFEANVADAPASLDALLHRFPVSLATAQALQVGSVLPLPGCTVNSVRLLSPDGKEVAQAKLGQMGGYRAVRIEAAPAPQLAELPGAAADTSMPHPDPMGLANNAEAHARAEDLPTLMDESTDAVGIDLIADGLPAPTDLPFDPDAV